MSENEISYVIRGCIFNVFNNLGPGLLESVYEAALHYELTKAGLQVGQQVPIPMFYDMIKLDVGFRLDLLVEDRVVIEIKSVDTLLDVHHKQLVTYLRLSDKKLGILVNFNTDDIRSSMIRKVNGL